MELQDRILPVVNVGVFRVDRAVVRVIDRTAEQFVEVELSTNKIGNSRSLNQNPFDSNYAFSPRNSAAARRQ